MVMERALFLRAVFGDFSNEERAKEFCKAVKERFGVSSVIFFDRYGEGDFNFEVAVERTDPEVEAAIEKELGPTFGVTWAEEI